MIYKYLVRHRIKFRSFIKLKIKEMVNNLSSPFVAPIDTTDINSCFIVGCGHSGTTLMAAKVGLAKESFLIGRETGNFLPGRGIYTSRAVALEWMYFAEMMSKTCIVEKTPKHVHTPHRIKKVLPQAKFIVMLRNPLDTCASIKARFRKRKFSLPIERWNMDNRAAMHLKQQYPDDTLCVRYEDLTENPRETLRTVYEFLGLTWDEAVLGSGKTAYNRAAKQGNMSLRAEQTSREIRPNNGTWKSKIDASQEKQIFAETAEIAAKLGYDRDTILQYLNKKE